MTVPFPALAARWRVLVTPPLRGYANMAVEMALMQRARCTGEAVFRVYSWAAPTISFGRNQTAAGSYDANRIAAAGVGVVRRPTGGRSILHRREVTYSVAAPTSGDVSLASAYAGISGLLLAALNRLGVGAEFVVPLGRSASPSAAPCFAAPAKGELQVGGQKLVGSAQWRDRGALLQHGSILVEDDQHLLPSFMISEHMQGAPPATLRSVLGRAPSPDEIAAAVFAVIQCSLDHGVTDLAAQPVMDASLPFQAPFQDDSWTWRR